MKEAILLTDGYKLDHRRQYPENTEYVYSDWTPRSCHYYPEATEGAVVFGIQYFIKEYLMKQFQQDFFNKPKDIAVAEFKRRVDTFRRLITEVYPTGFVSIVSDTWDFWKVMTEYLPKLKDEILARDGRLVIRPDIGVGSYTYQYKSRDSLGFAMKATWCQVNGEGREIFKDPKTDDGTKKSLKGLICVQSDGNKYIVLED